jgi:hypothetical protein
MPMLELSDEQVIELAKRLPREKQDALLRELLLLRWSNWESLSQYGQARARELAAQRGLSWDTMNDAEREAFVDDLVHEDRGCVP